MLYFGYGMNTNLEGMAGRCPKATSLGYAQLLEHKFRFAGPADVIKHPGSIVHGVLWDLTPECLKALDMLEGFPHFYGREWREVEYYGERFDALVVKYFAAEYPDYPDNSTIKIGPLLDISLQQINQI